MTIPAVSRRNIAIRLEATVWISSISAACHGTPNRPAPDEADPLHLPRVQRRGRPRPARHERVADADRGMASRIEIATDAVDRVVTDYDVVTAPAHKRASMDAEYRARGGRSPALILRTKPSVRRDLRADEAKMGKDPVSCQSCGHENPAGARFCNDCGAHLAAPTITPEPRSYTPPHLVEKILASQSALRGERKLVTVLFADVVRSMELAERVDPEEWHRLLDRLFRILAGGVHRYEGTINQYTGDGIMALFGAPIAHEDHAQRACAAALDLARELGALAEDVWRESGLEFAVRMGLNSGEVVVGRIGDDLRMDYTAQGHVVGLAARVQQLAPPGGISVTEQTARLASGFFDLLDRGEQNLKGASVPVRVFDLRGPGPIRSRFARSRAGSFGAGAGGAPYASFPVILRSDPGPRSTRTHVALGRGPALARPGERSRAGDAHRASAGSGVGRQPGAAARDHAARVSAGVVRTGRAAVAGAPHCPRLLDVARRLARIRPGACAAPRPDRRQCPRQSPLRRGDRSLARRTRRAAWRTRRVRAGRPGRGDRTARDRSGRPRVAHRSTLAARQGRAPDRGCGRPRCADGVAARRGRSARTRSRRVARAARDGRAPRSRGASG